MAVRAEIRVSVRSLVEFILRSGNIDNRKAAMPENAMLEGGRIHRMIQRRMGADYHAEVPLKYRYETENYAIIVEGRADGIIVGEDSLQAESIFLTDKDGEEPPKTEYTVTVDEIKGTYKELTKLKKPIGVHLAQAKCYAYIYAKENELESIRVRMTYCNIDTEQIKYFHYDYMFSDFLPIPIVKRKLQLSDRFLSSLSPLELKLRPFPVLFHHVPKPILQLRKHIVIMEIFD